MAAEKTTRNPADPRGHPLAALCALFCAAKAAFLLFYTIRGQYIMDEYFQAGQWLYLRDYYRAHAPLKNLLYVCFYGVAHALAGSGNAVMLVARLETFVVVAATVLLFWYACRALGLRVDETLFALAVLLTFTNYLEHAFRVRADSVALLFIVAAFTTGVRGRLGSTWRMAAMGALLGLAFLCTQKSVYAAFAAGVAGAVAIHHSDGPARVVRAGAACLGAFLAMLAAYSLLIGGPSPVAVVVAMFTEPVSFARSAPHFYPYLRRYTVQTLTQNLLPYTLCAAGLVAASVQWRAAPASRRFAIVFSAVLTACIFAHNQPWPYVYATAVPFLAPWAGDLLRWCRTTAPRYAMPLVYVTLVLLSLSFVRNVIYSRRTNEVQNEVTAHAERMLGPVDRYEDGTGMIPTRRMAVESWWDAINVALFYDEIGHGDYSRLKSIIAGQPKLWIINYRVAALARALRPILLGSYVRVEPNILLSGSPVSSGDQTFIARWSGPYALFGASGPLAGRAVVIDGRTLPTPALVSIGAHRVRLAQAGAGPAYLLPADASLGRVMPAEGPARDLFIDVYE